MSDDIVLVDERYISPLVPVAEAIATYEAMRDFIKSAMVAGRDYGVIPGTKKPTLLQPGAEKLMRFFSLDFVIVPGQHITDWTGQDHGGEPFFYYEFTGRAMRGSRIIAECVGSCNSWEKKYRYRQGNRVCPNCGQPTIFKSKNDPGFYCWVKKGGCGSVFLPDDERITKQETGMVKNPDIFDTVNTLQKMSIKRSLVGVSLIACNAHEYFTQDVEDYTEGVFEEIAGQNPQNKKPATPAKLKPREDAIKELRPLSPELLRNSIALRTQRYVDKIATKAQRELLVMQLTQLCNGVELERHCLTKYLTGVASSKDLSGAQVLSFLDWLGLEDHEDGKIPCQFAVQEAQAVFNTALVAEGQQELDLKGD